MKKSSKNRIIEIYERAIIDLNPKIYLSYEFTCNALRQYKRSSTDKQYIDDVNMALEYFNSQRPTAIKYKKFYNDKFYSNGVSWWGDYIDLRGSEEFIYVQGRRIAFLKLLIIKLSK